MQFGIHSGNVPTLYQLSFYQKGSQLAHKKHYDATKRLYYAAIR
jgi:hypothetical protein